MYEFEGRVRYSECDEQGNLSVLALINYLQDCTIFHSEDIGRGVGYMTERHLAWLIAAWQIEVVRLPRSCETIRVRTWCHSMSRTLASRNFVILDADGEQLVRADSIWFVFDSQAGRPIRIGSDQLVFLSDTPPLDLPPTQRRLKVVGETVPTPDIVVSEAQLDTNRHVNNAQYVAMAMGALSSLAAEGGRPAPATTELRRICVQYQQQAHLGDVICPRVALQDDGATIDLTDQAGSSFAVVQLTFER